MKYTPASLRVFRSPLTAKNPSVYGNTPLSTTIHEKSRMPRVPRLLPLGLLRDSDNFRGIVTGIAQPNFAAGFELPVP